VSDGLDQEGWERRWAQVIASQPEKVAGRPPSSHLLTELEALSPGRALDAGCGHGAETILLATSGWTVTAVDFSASALEQARATARARGEDVAGRITWIQADLGDWVPPEGSFDLVVCLYLHVAGSVGELVTRLAAGVAPGGSLLMVGHLPVDPETGEPTMAAGQVQVGVGDVVDILDPEDWSVVVAEERRRAAAGSGVDAVVRAVRKG